MLFSLKRVALVALVAALAACAQTQGTHVRTGPQRPKGSLIQSTYGSPWIRFSATTLSAATTTTITVPAGFREIRIISRTTGGMVIGAPVKINFNGDTTSNYNSGSNYVQGNATVAGNAPGTNSKDTAGQLALTASAATVVDLELIINVFPLVVSGASRPFNCTFNSRGSTDATFITGTSNGFWDDTSSTMTSILITYGSAATGTVDAYGQP